MNRPTPTVKTIYGIIILLATGEPLIVKESDNFEECKVTFDQLEAEWIRSRKTKGAIFQMKDPWIFSCDPQFILRMSLVPKVTPKVAGSENPYQKRMEQMGFANAMKNPVPRSELMDGGYSTDE